MLDYPVSIARIPANVLIRYSMVISMIDVVFWTQVKAAWSKRCDIALADPEKIKGEAPPSKVIDQLKDFKL